MFTNWLTRGRAISLQMAGYAATFAIAALLVNNYFGQDLPWRWVMVGLMALFVSLQWLTHLSRWRPSVQARRAVFGLEAVLVVVLMALPPGNDFVAILFFVLSAEATIICPPREWALWITGFGVATVTLMVARYGLSSGVLISLIYCGGYYFFAAFGKLAVEAETASAKSQALLTELQNAHQQLQQYAAQVEELAVAEERNRLAREMHDTLGHRLTVAAVQLEGAQRLIATEPDRAAAMVRTVREQVAEALNELRHTVAALRAPVEADLSLPKALQRLVASFQEATGIVVRLLLPDALPALPDPHRLALYRAAQEALTNVQRHAKASQVTLQLAHNPAGAVPMIALHIIDNGAGLAPGARPSGFGLAGLTERAEQLGGNLYLTPRPEGGAQLTMQLPLPPQLSHE